MDKRIRALVAALLLLACANVAAQSGCQFAPGFTEMVWHIDFGDIVVQRDAPVGTVLLDRELNSYQFNRPIYSTCTAASPIGQYSRMYPLVLPWSPDYYRTAVSGVGVQIVHPPDLGNVEFRNGAVSWELRAPYQTAGPFRVRLVKTGPITSGSLDMGARLFSWTSVLGDGTNATIAEAYFGSGRVTQVACRPVSTAFTVPMNRTTTSDFDGVGTTAGETPFSITMDCDAGTRLSVELDGDQVGSPDNGTVALAPASTAHGLGLQLVYANSPVFLGRTFDVGISSAGGHEQIKFSARYIQTAPVVKGGTADATVSYTFTYN